MRVGTLTAAASPSRISAPEVIRYSATYGRSRRALWWLLSAWCLVWAAAHVRQYGYSWRFFALGGRLLLHPNQPGGGLHVYAAHPELQIGPLALLVAAPLQALGPSLGKVAATVTMIALGPVVLAVAAAVRGRSGRVSRALLVSTGILLLPVWAEVAAHYGHLDDVLALLLGVSALATLARGRPLVTAVLLAAAADSKPWAVAFGALLVALPTTERRRASLVFLAGVAGPWIPFVLADPGTLAIGHFTIPNVADSALRALGVSTAGTPSWDRPVQILLGGGIAALAAWRGRWAAVLFAVVAARLLLDPQTYPYYTAGLVVAAAVLDLARPGRMLPWWTVGAFGLYAFDQLARGSLAPHVLGMVRAAYCIVGLAWVALAGTGDSRGNGAQARGHRTISDITAGGESDAWCATRTTTLPPGRARRAPR